jgi:hypothetical protein
VGSDIPPSQHDTSTPVILCKIAHMVTIDPVYLLGFVFDRYG